MMKIETTHKNHAQSIGRRATPDLESIAFFGRTLADYEQFFDFRFEDIQAGEILDCASGAASFAAEAVRRGLHVVAVDPMYVLRFAAIRALARSDLDRVFRGVEAAPERFDFSAYGSLEGLQRAKASTKASASSSSSSTTRILIRNP